MQGEAIKALVRVVPVKVQPASARTDVDLKTEWGMRAGGGTKIRDREPNMPDVGEAKRATAEITAPAQFRTQIETRPDLKGEAAAITLGQKRIQFHELVDFQQPQIRLNVFERIHCLHVARYRRGRMPERAVKPLH